VKISDLVDFDVNWMMLFKKGGCNYIWKYLVIYTFLLCENQQKLIHIFIFLIFENFFTEFLKMYFKLYNSRIFEYVSNLQKWAMLILEPIKNLI